MLIPGLVPLSPPEETTLCNVYVPFGTVVVFQLASHPYMVGVAVATTALLRLPPVTWYWTLVTPGEAAASLAQLTDSVAAFDGSTTLVMGAVTVIVAEPVVAEPQIVGEDGPDLPSVLE